MNILNSALDRVEKVMGIEPEPFSPDLIGAVNRLEAIENQLILANDMVVSIAGEVMGIDPNPFIGDLGLAFEDVQTAAKNIVSFINNNPVPDQLISAFGDVQLSAQAIVDTVDEHLGATCPEIMGDCIQKLNKLQVLIDAGFNPAFDTPIDSEEVCHPWQCSGFGAGSTMVIVPYETESGISYQLWIECVKGYYDGGYCEDPNQCEGKPMTQRCYYSDSFDSSVGDWRVDADITAAEWAACRDDLLNAVN